MFEDANIDDLFHRQGSFLLSLCCLSSTFNFFFDGLQHPPVETQRVNWLRHKERMVSLGHFRRMHQMNPDAFEKLVLILDTILTANITKAYNRSPAGSIISEIRLHCLLRYLAGGSYLNICDLVLVPHYTFYFLFWQTCDAMADCPELDLILPTTNSQLQTASLGFESISHQGIMSGCVGVIDGWLCPIEVPPLSAV
jgi:hypothetical protein